MLGVNMYLGMYETRDEDTQIFCAKYDANDKCFNLNFKLWNGEV